MRKSPSPNSEPNLAKRALGAHGENLTSRWYGDQGYEVLHRNWRCSEGEVDLVLRSGDTIVFCEVKTRTSAAFGTPAEAVGYRKQSKLRRLAAMYLAEQRPGFAAGIRFDVACVTSGAVEVVENAF